MPEEVVAVHGLTEEFLKDYPVFAEVAAAFVEFVGEDGVLVAHNASFDIKFINFASAYFNPSSPSNSTITRLAINSISFFADEKLRYLQPYIIGGQAERMWTAFAPFS